MCPEPVDFLASSSSLGSEEEGSLLSLSLGSLSLSLGSLLDSSLLVKELLLLRLELRVVLFLLALVPVRLDRVLPVLEERPELREPVNELPRLDMDGALLASVDPPVFLELMPLVETDGGAALDLPVRLLLLDRDDLELPDRD